MKKFKIFLPDVLAAFRSFFDLVRPPVSFCKFYTHNCHFLFSEKYFCDYWVVTHFPRHFGKLQSVINKNQDSGLFVYNQITFKATA